MPQALPFLSLGLGVWQTIKSNQMQEQALAEAKKPRFTEEMAKYARESGTSNIQANLASRGMLDSSMLPGGLAQLEKGIGEARAGAGTMGDVPGMLWQGAMGLGSGGSQTLGNLAESYMLNRLFGKQGTPAWAGSQGYNPQFPEIVPGGYNTGRPWYPPNYGWDTDAWQWGT